MIKMKHHGLTLIELIVVIAIIIILSGVSLSAYFQFSQRQAVMNDARNFSTMLRRVQAMAKNLVYPPGCSGLTSYRVYSCMDCQYISADANCGVGGGAVIDQEAVLVKTFFSSAVNVTFMAGSGSIDTDVEFPIKTLSDDYTVVVKLEENGNISTYEN